MGTRRESRERALELSYEMETRNLNSEMVFSDLLVTPDEYSIDLVQGVERHGAEIDALLKKHSENWTIERMPPVDRALLRIGGYELGWQKDVPTAVIIDEAVELAHRYSTKESGRFVNALLAQLAEDLRS